MRRSRWAIVVSGAAFTAVLFLGAAAGLAWALLPPLDPAPYLRAVASGQLLDRGGKTLYVALNREGNWSLPGAADDFSPYLRQATIAAEDQRFHAHPGVDPIAVLRAAWQNIRQGGVASGASTLTMQLVKLEGLDSRRPAGKLAQAVYALRLEKAAEKDAILDAYLNRAPYGMNLIGADAAAWRYFGKRAQTLNLPEAALLAGLPRAPSRLNPLAHPERARERRDYVLRRMHAEGFIDATQRDQALAAPVNAAWRDFPRHAPHLAVPLAAPLAAGERVTLTLDQALQARLETLLPHYLKRFNGSISNGALLVVDVETGDLLARVGSAGFFATPGGGQVDSCLAPRSPGSTLKPFLFGWAMERQLLYPSEVLLDEVLDYGGYNPGNFDGLFNGPVTATEALRYSLNVPSVALLGRSGVAGFHDWLGKAGMTTLHRTPEEYGLGLVLGNCEARLEELARLYLSIASLGERNELRLTGAEPPQPAIFSPEVCRMLYAMLAQPFPEELSPGLTRTGGNALPVCWKTGTSTGYHDAWTFAFNRHYLVAVWLGNNSGATARQLIGARAALPLASRIFRELPPKNGPAWPAPEASDKEVAMCALSGLPATEGCPETARWRLPASFWRSRVCALHPVSRLGIAARAERPAGPASWDLATLAARPTGEVAATPIRALGITVPANGAEFLLTGVDGGDQVRLQSTLGESEAVHWYVDDRYLGASGPDAPIFWALTSGAHRVTCVAHDGRTASARFTVARPGNT
ncbi:MAG: penicillin-binding protein 1C [Candidatus Hydrogenedentes bacterium]|nr:penicillin-binding protein 1C [Candidatus Hydrogenedentota bacterium]